MSRSYNKLFFKSFFALVAISIFGGSATAVASFDPPVVVVVDPPVSTEYDAEAAKGILNLHNQYRDQVKPGPATDMKMMMWDDGLATTAQGWANECKWHHGNPKWTADVIGPDNTPIGEAWVGQNMFMGTTGAFTWLNAVSDWNDEKFDYDYCTVKCKPGKRCGHYTQVVWADSTHVGCGVKSCTTGPNTGQDIIICNYLPGGNWRGEHPYALKDKEAACKKNKWTPGEEHDEF